MLSPYAPGLMKPVSLWVYGLGSDRTTTFTHQRILGIFGWSWKEKSTREMASTIICLICQSVRVLLMDDYFPRKYAAASTIPWFAVR